MPCYKPLKVRQYVSGKTLKFVQDFHSKTPNAELPCGRCIGCRLEKAKSWAIRCVHESQMHENNVFLTLTYSDENLPAHASLKKSDFQKFIRALRKKTKQKIRYYMCGEYGEPTEKNNFVARPHYHALLFGYEFLDARFVNIRNGNRVYLSETLDKIWGHGTCEIGTVTFQSAGYVARYILKKQNGEPAKIHYAVIDEHGEIIAHRIPEYTNMSLRPGIGKKWYEKYKSDIFPADICITPDGRTMPVPTYYRNLLEKEDAKLYEELRKLRVEKAQDNPDNTPERLSVREFVQNDKLTRLKRGL